MKPPRLPSVCAVTVTYGERTRLVCQVIDAILACGARKVVVVDNGCAPGSRAALASFAENRRDRIRVVRLPENLGSAGGFARGIESAAREEDCEFIWLLDDDNCPMPGALSSLLQLQGSLGGGPDVAVSARRKICSKEGVRPVPRQHARNSFFNFHLKLLPAKLARKAGAVRGGRSEFGVAELPYAPYGGFLFHRSWIDRVGLPDARLFLHYDDYEFTHRFRERGGRLYVAAEPQIVEIDQSWYHKERRITALVSDRSDDRLMFLAVRNRVFLERQFVDSLPLYLLNAAVYVFALSLLALLLERKPRALMRRLTTLKRAFAKGRRGDFSPSGNPA